MTYRANWFWQIKVTTVTSCLTGSKAVVELPLYQAGVQPGIRERLIGMFIKNAISLKIYFSNSKIIAVSLPGMKRRLSIFMPLFHLPVFWFGYFDGFKTLSSVVYNWAERWPDMNDLSNFDEERGENFPGWSMEALQYIYETRNAATNGHETLDTDASVLAAAAGDLACERYVLSKGKLQVEVLCNLDQVPPAGAIAFAVCPPIQGATGLPVRMWAILPD